MCNPPTCVYRVYIAACCVICLIGAVAVIAIGMALGYRMGEDSVYNFKENRPNGVAVTTRNREQMTAVQRHFRHITTSLTGSGIVSGTISMIGGYGACCNLAMALYLFMVGVALLVVAEVATGAVVYYKQTLIIETLTEFRSKGICGTICFLDNLVSQQLMSAVVIVIGMTVLQVGQIICAYCIVRRLNTPKPVRNIQSAVRRMTAHLFSTVGAAASSSPSPGDGGNKSISPEAHPMPAIAVASPVLSPQSPRLSSMQAKPPQASKLKEQPLQPLQQAVKLKEPPQQEIQQSQQQYQPQSTQTYVQPQIVQAQIQQRDSTSSPLRRPELVSSGQQTDDYLMNELSRPLLSASKEEENTAASSKQIEEVLEEAAISQKSCVRYSAKPTSRPHSVGSSKEIVCVIAEPIRQPAEQQQQMVAVQQICEFSSTIQSSASAVSPCSSTAPEKCTSAVTDSNPVTGVVSTPVLPCLSSTTHQQHANASVSLSTGVVTSVATAPPHYAPKIEQRADIPSSYSASPPPSGTTRPSQCRKLIPTSCQTSLPAPHYVRKLNDFSDIPIPTTQQLPHGSPSTQRRRHVMIPVASSVPTQPLNTTINRPSTPNTAQLENSTRSAAQILRFAALPHSSVIHNNHTSNMAQNRRARSYSNVTDNEGLETADYIDLRELHRSPGTPGRKARFGHLHNRNAVCIHQQQQQQVFPNQAHAAGSYPDRSQWRVPEIRTLYVSYV